MTINAFHGSVQTILKVHLSFRRAFSGLVTRVLNISEKQRCFKDCEGTMSGYHDDYERMIQKQDTNRVMPRVRQ